MQNWEQSQMRSYGDYKYYGQTRERSETYLLNLLKLVHTEDTPGVFATRAGLLSEACRIAPVPTYS
jgi:hypothetical protein